MRRRFLGPRILTAVSACLLIAAVYVSSAMAITRQYVCCYELPAATSISDFVYHNHRAHNMDPNGNWPTGIYFRTSGGIKTGVVNGYGFIWTTVDAVYYNAPYCWNRDATISHYVNSCNATWGA